MGAHVAYAPPGMHPRRHGRAASLAVVVVVAGALAGCGASVPQPASPEATLRDLRSQLAVLRRPAATPDRPPWGSMLEGLVDLRRIGPRDVDGLAFWLYVDLVSGQVCGESDTDPPTRIQLWAICESSAGLDAPRQFRVADSSRDRDDVTYGLARDGRGCALLRLRDGTVRRIPIVRNGWARRTPKANPVASARATRSGCAATRSRATGALPTSVGPPR